MTGSLLVMKKWLKKLGDPELTAKFQRSCGVRSLVDDNDRHSVNGNIVATESNGVGKFTHGNSTVTPNGRMKHIDDGHGANGTNGIQNGFLKERKLTNGYHKNLGLIETTDCASHSNGVGEGLPNGGEHKTTNGIALNGNDFVNNNQKGSPNGHSVYHDDHDSNSFSINNIAIHWLFCFGANLGNELFYVLFFSFSIWNFDCFIIRRTIIVWGVIMYAGQAAKDVIKWPRPKSPPVIPLEKRYQLEYGMPSTHAMVGVAIPFSVLIFMYGRYEMNIAVSFVLAVTWCLLVSLSRLYLGMHSVLDVIAGVLLSALLMLVTVPSVDAIDRFVISHQLSLPVIMLLCVFLSYIYPSMTRWSTTRGDTILILGVFSGIYAGLWLTGKMTEFKPAPEVLPIALTLPSTSDLKIALLRQMLGSVVLFSVLTFTKKSILYALSWYLGYDPKDPETKQRFVIELPYKYLSYFISGTFATYFVPLFFAKLNLARESYYSEIFSFTT